MVLSGVAVLWCNMAVLCALYSTQIKRHQLSEDSFWTKANEESFESIEFFQDIEKTFGTGRARNMDLESAPKLKMPKIKELKVLDAKSAQNICESIYQVHFSVYNWPLLV